MSRPKKIRRTKKPRQGANTSALAAFGPHVRQREMPPSVCSSAQRNRGFKGTVSRDGRGMLLYMFRMLLKNAIASDKENEILLMGQLKGQSRKTFFLRFFPQSEHSGPIRDVIGPFCFLENFHRVIVLLKRLPCT